MLLKDLKPGTKLELVEIERNRSHEDAPALLSVLEFVEDDNNIVVGAPIVNGEYYLIHVYSMIDINFYAMDSLFSFRGKVTKRFKNGDLAYLGIEKVGDIHKIQRRNYYRFKCFLNLKYRVIKQAVDEPRDDGQVEHAQKPKDEYKKALSVNISGGGICILAHEKLEINTVVEIVLHLNSKSPKALKGIVKRVELEKSGGRKYEIGIVFKDINENDRQDIITYIFNEQRKLREKGLI